MEKQRPFFIDQAILDDTRSHVPASGTFYGLLRPGCNIRSWAEERKTAENWSGVTCEDCLKLRKGTDEGNWGPWDRETVWTQGPIPLGE